MAHYVHLVSFCKVFDEDVVGTKTCLKNSIKPRLIGIRRALPMNHIVNILIQSKERSRIGPFIQNLPKGCYEYEVKYNRKDSVRTA